MVGNVSFIRKSASVLRILGHLSSIIYAISVESEGDLVPINVAACGTVQNIQKISERVRQKMVH
jgi:hypothetical protein